jgi:hypothetical protein
MMIFFKLFPFISYAASNKRTAVFTLGLGDETDDGNRDFGA